MSNISSFFDGAFSSGNKIIERIKQNGSSADLRKEQQKLYEQLGSLVYKEAKINPEPYMRFGSMIDLLDEIEEKISLVENLPKQRESVTRNSAVTAASIDAGFTCPNCGDLVSESDKFCMGCGNSLEGIKFEKKPTCNQCGMPIDEEARFCENCGASLINTQDETKPELQSDAEVDSSDRSEPIEDTIESSLIQENISNKAVNSAVVSNTEGTVPKQSEPQVNVEESGIKATESLRSEEVNIDKQKSAARFCSHCGLAIKEGWRFCGNCGAFQD